MNYKRLAIGACIAGSLLLGYTCYSRYQRLERKLESLTFESSLEKRTEGEPDNIELLLSYLRESRSSELHNPAYKSNFEEIWSGLSAETKWRIVKEITAYKTKKIYSDIKEKSKEGITELKDFFQRKVVKDVDN